MSGYADLFYKNLIWNSSQFSSLVLEFQIFSEIEKKKPSRAGFSNLNQPRAAHLSARSYGGPHGAKLGVFYKFSEEF